MQDLVGGCLCGQVRYRSSAAPVFTAACHCKHCQKTSGSAFALLVAVPRDSVSYDGQMSTHRDAGTDSGLPVERSFCPTCGSAIVSIVSAAPTLAFLKAGTLDDTSGVQPQMEIWCEHAQPWLSLNDKTTHLPRNPPL